MPATEPSASDTTGTVERFSTTWLQTFMVGTLV